MHLAVVYQRKWRARAMSLPLVGCKPHQRRMTLPVAFMRKTKGRFSSRKTSVGRAIHSAMPAGSCRANYLWNQFAEDDVHECNQHEGDEDGDSVCSHAAPSQRQIGEHGF